MSSPRRSLVFTLVLTGSLACGRRSEPLRRATIVGCYDLQWSYTHLADTSTSLKSMLPQTLTLDTNGLVGTVKPKVVGTLKNSGWRLKDDRSIVVFWSSGSGGLGLDLRSRGDTLEGDARLHDDAGGDWRVGQLRACRTPCVRSPF